MHVVVAGKKHRLSPARALGKGGEAEVYDLGGGLALKLYKAPDHPDLDGQPEAQRAAQTRLARAEQKLRAFPANVSPRVVGPVELARSPKGDVVGFTMNLVDGAVPLSRFAEPPFRRAGASQTECARVLLDVHDTVAALHRAGVVIGDFNDLNVLVKDQQAFLIDADSFQYGGFLTEVFTERFTDPLLCDPTARRPILCRPFTTSSDWYAYAVLVVQSLLLVGPYGGAHRPATAADKIPDPQRPLRRISIFHPDVRSPKAALPPQVLPDELLHHLVQVFEKDERRPFPKALLEDLRFERCAGCGVEHARARCPSCRSSPAGKRAIVVERRGTVTARLLFSTTGTVLHAELHDGALRLVHHDGKRYLREDGVLVREGPLDPRLSFGLSATTTLVARDGVLDVVEEGNVRERLSLDAAPEGARSFGTNDRRRFWLDQGQLKRNGPLGAERVGDVLAGRTRLFVGPRFGFGMYEAGALRVAFVFDIEHPGLKDGLALPRFRGHLVDLHCRFSDERVLVVAACEQEGRREHHAVLVARDGRVLAEAGGDDGDESWLPGAARACLVGDFVFVPTDDGLVRVEAVGGVLTKTRAYPDTEPFVGMQSGVLFGREGLVVVNDREAYALGMA